MIEYLKNKNGDSEAALYLPDGLTADRSAIRELKEFLQVNETIESLRQTEGFLDKACAVDKVIVTPDFHKGAGIPIGTVALTDGFIIPQAMGNDVNCGMRSYITDLTEDEILENLNAVMKKLRYVFFEGGRQIPMTGRQREAMFRNGLTGLLETHGETKDSGIWAYYRQEREAENLSRTAFKGSLEAGGVEGLEDFIGGSRTATYDEQIGTIGGGNHFVEIQRVAEIYDGQTANAWGLRKGAVVFMIHSGSLMIGHHTGMLNKKICKAIYPGDRKHPSNEIYILPDSDRFRDEWERVWSCTYNAANFGFANRLFLGLMLQKALTEVIHEFDMKLIYDSPHNFIWNKEIDGRVHYLHRKGACSAGGFEEMADTPYAYYGEPVMIPGSMGSSSYMFCGNGNGQSLWSASHGAGRKMSRGEAIHESDRLFREFMERFHIVTPIDPDRADLRGRADIIDKWRETIKAEAPYAYKDISEIAKVHVDHKMAALVARMEPVMTIKA